MRRSRITIHNFENTYPLLRFPLMSTLVPTWKPANTAQFSKARCTVLQLAVTSTGEPCVSAPPWYSLVKRAQLPSTYCPRSLDIMWMPMELAASSMRNRTTDSACAPIVIQLVLTVTGGCSCQKVAGISWRSLRNWLWCARPGQSANKCLAEHRL